MTSLFDAVATDAAVPHFRPEVCEEATDWEIAQDNTVHANRLARRVTSQDFAGFAFDSVHMKTYKAKFDELISRASPRVHALLGDRRRYRPLLAQANAGGMVFTAPDFQVSSVGTKCLDEVERHFHSGFYWKPETFQTELCGEDELILDELRKSGVRRLGIVHHSVRLLYAKNAQADGDAGRFWREVRVLSTTTP